MAVALRVHKIEFTPTGALRVHKIQVDTTPVVPVVPLALRIHKIEIETVPKAYSSLRIHKISVDIIPALRVLPLASQSATPGTFIERTASTYAGFAVTTWTWRVVSQTGGLLVELHTSGAYCYFYAPSDAPPQAGDAPRTGSTVVIGVTATGSGQTSPEEQFTVVSPPQTQWTGGPDEWIGAILPG